MSTVVAAGVAGAVVVVGATVGLLVALATSDSEDKKKTKPKTIKLYHYTDKQGKNGILRNEKIASSQINQGDAILGSGVYLTSVGPQTSDYEIARNNWDDGDANAQHYIKAGRLDYVFEIEVPVDKVFTGKGVRGRSVYVFRSDLNLKKYTYKVYRRSGGKVIPVTF